MDVQRLGTCFILIGVLLVTHGGVEFVSANTISNVALGKNAFQTDTANGGTPALAVDGDPSTCSESASALADWTLNLGDYFIIEEVSETRSESQWVSSVVKATSENAGWDSTNIKGPNDNSVWMADAHVHAVHFTFKYEVWPKQLDIYFNSGAGSEKAIECWNAQKIYVPIWGTIPNIVTNAIQTVSHVVDDSSCYSRVYRVKFAVSNHKLLVDAISLRGEQSDGSLQQWVSDIWYKTSEVSGYEASNLKGVNDGAVWQPELPLNLQYVEVMFDKKVHVTRVDIYERSGAGSEKAIHCKVGENWISLWSKTPVSSSSDAQIFSPKLTASCFSNHIMVEFLLLQHDLKVDAISVHADKCKEPVRQKPQT